jgi:uncharacterized membrane protein YdjX (TVP38/TMEM64 family)
MYDFLDLLRQPGWFSLAAAFVAYVVLSLAMLPVWPVTILLGSLYGVWMGLLIAMPASVAGALAVFLLGQSVLRGWARRRMAGSDRLLAITRVVGDERGWIALLLRLSPVVPFNLINYALSVTDLRLGVYFVTTIVGILPATLMYLYLGAATASVTRASYTGVELAAYVLGLVATVLAVWLIGRAVRKTLDAQLPATDVNRKVLRSE